jgi:hypothetical protein
MTVAQARERCDDGQECVACRAGFGRTRRDVAVDAGQLLGDPCGGAGSQRRDHYGTVEVEEACGIGEHGVGEDLVRAAGGVPGGDAGVGVIHQPCQGGRKCHVSGGLHHGAHPSREATSPRTAASYATGGLIGTSGGWMLCRSQAVRQRPAPSRRAPGLRHRQPARASHAPHASVPSGHEIDGDRNTDDQPTQCGGRGQRATNRRVESRLRRAWFDHDHQSPPSAAGCR